jgi:hypothetical protein
MKIFIYYIKELEEIMKFYKSVPSEMDLYDMFLSKLKLKYEVVNDINESDIAFIPIDFIKLIYGSITHENHHILYTQLKTYDNYSDLTPTVQPPTFGVGHKDNFIKFFWNNFVKHNIKSDLKIPHFILYSYVLFEISFEPIDKNIFILSYEDEVSFFNTTTTFKMGTDNRMIMIPYVLNGKPINSFPTMTKIISCEKTRELTFIGSLYSDNSEDRPLINRVRNFILNLNYEVYIGDMSNIEQELMNTKYLFVLRGDTPTRVSFYQSLVYNIVPIIFEEELSLYQKIFTKDIDLKESCLVLPNKDGMSDIEYSKIVDKILNKELLDPNNYFNKIKNHEILFNQINYFSDECLPIDISMEKIKFNYSNRLVS